MGIKKAGNKAVEITEQTKKIKGGVSEATKKNLQSALGDVDPNMYDKLMSEVVAWVFVLKPFK